MIWSGTAVKPSHSPAFRSWSETRSTRSSTWSSHCPGRKSKGRLLNVYFTIWWAFGHSSQQINVAAHISIWYAVAAIAFGAKPMSERVSRNQRRAMASGMTVSLASGCPTWRSMAPASTGRKGLSSTDTSDWSSSAQASSARTTASACCAASISSKARPA